MKNANTKRSSASKSKAKSFTTWAAGIMLAASLLFIGLLTGCPNAAGGNKPVEGNTPNDKVIGGAALRLSEKKDITITAVTQDGVDISVEGCTETVLNSNVETTLHATGDKIILKGKITQLYCYSNQLTSLNVQGLTQLQILNCVNNRLTSLDVQGLTQLYNLNCANNRLISLNIQGLTQLPYLDCHDNQLTVLDVQGLTQLQRLSCSSNQLTSLDVQGLTQLQYLSCNSNQLTALNVQGLTQLKDLDCCYNQLTAFNVQGLTQLKELNCYTNQLDEAAFTAILNALPSRSSYDGAKCILFVDSGSEQNYKFIDPVPADLKTAFEAARDTKHWSLKKFDSSWQVQDITLP